MTVTDLTKLKEKLEKKKFFYESASKKLFF